MRQFKIAFFGIRKFPPRSGAAGADTYAYNLIKRFSNDNYKVVVFEKGSWFKIRKLDNVIVHEIPTIKIKGLSTFLHSLICTILILIKYRPSIAHTQNGGNAIFCHILNKFGVATFCSFDGIDTNRKDWGYFARLYLSFSEKLSARLGKKLIVDNIPTQKYVERKYGIKTTHIPFGSSNNLKPSSKNPLNIFSSKKYILFIGRFVKDKNIKSLISAFKQSKLSKEYNLVLIGGPSENETNYSRYIKKQACDNIIIPGFYYGEDINKIIIDASLYVQPSLVEGLSPVILHVISHGTPILVSDIMENYEILKDYDFTFKVNDIDNLSAKIDEFLLDFPHEKYRKIQQRIVSKYNWDTVYKQHKEIFERMTK